MPNVILSSINNYDEEEVLIIPDAKCLEDAQHLFPNDHYTSLQIEGINDIKWELNRPELKKKSLR